ncbi:MAG: MATE family efflux transporter [Spirochaetales bacterium]|nr:MATE family efflux transporter [Spirochaetales bacterium]
MYMDNSLMKSAGKKTILGIAIPIIINNISQQIQILFDWAFLGNYDSSLFSAIGNAAFPYGITWVILISLTTGTAVLISQYLGAKKNETAKQVAEASLKYNTFIGIALYLMWLLNAEYIFKALGVKEPVLAYCIGYMRFLSISLVILGSSATSAVILQAKGFTRPIMYTGLIRNILNIILDWILIFGIAGFPELGIKGAGLATTISNLIADPILIFFAFKSKTGIFKISLWGIIKSKWHIYKKAIRIGLPASLEDLLWNFGAIILVAFLNMQDIASTGIYTLIFNIEMTSVSIYSGIARAALILVGRKTGEKDMASAIKTGLRCNTYALIICLVFFAVFLFFPRTVLRIFTNNRQMIYQSVPFLVFAAFILFPRAVNIVIGSSIRGYGDTKWMFITQVWGTAFVISLSALLIFFFKLKIYGVFTAILTDEIIRAVINCFRFIKGRNFRLNITGLTVYHFRD